MPYIKIELFKGRSVDQKREITSAVTKAICDTANCKPDAVWIVIDEKEKENWGINGQLIVDHWKG